MTSISGTHAQVSNTIHALVCISRGRRGVMDSFHFIWNSHKAPVYSTCMQTGNVMARRAAHCREFNFTVNTSDRLQPAKVVSALLHSAVLYVKGKTHFPSLIFKAHPILGCRLQMLYWVLFLRAFLLGIENSIMNILLVFFS